MSNLGDDVKKLGFGCMRFPKFEDGSFDIEQVKKMVDAFLEAGFTYFDTAWIYSGSEEVVRQSLVERYPRESYTIATKNAAWSGSKTREDAIAQLETSLNRLGTDYVDFYLLHNLGEARTQVFEDNDLWNWAFEMKRQGKVKHVGFFFHDTADKLEEILKAHPEAEFVQLQINYADWENPAIQSRKCYEVARKYNKPVVIMEPVKGGMLANPPEQVKEVFDKANPNVSYASWAIKFAANLEGVMTVLSGMSSIEQMQDNLSYMKDFTHLTDEEQAVINKAQEELAKVPLVSCTSCNYCAKVCPMNIGISASFTAMNLYTLYKDMAKAEHELNWHVDGQGKKRSSECIKCGACEAVCPQHIKIRDELENVTNLF